ncbi:MAG: ferredoxin [Elusimicrobia bacterium CG_4_9_14_3_um_filter_62_55]|nr:MAG: ferredoxin [Elusimicrobia bacterium CG_4_9_14_3_um_filter_62_55]
METHSVPYKRTVFVCTHARTDGRAACANAGSDGEAICSALKKEIYDRGLKGKIRVAASGCLDLCEKGPNVFIYPGEEWISGVTQADIPALIERIAANSKL